MAIYNLPAEFKDKVPQIVFDGKFDRAQWMEAQKTFLAELKAWCQKRNPTQDQNYIGEVISFPVADGQAQYMVASLKPVQLIHLPLGDAWNYQHIHLLKAKDIKEQVDRDKRLAAIFSKPKEL